MLMSAIMAVFAWRIIQAKRQNKSWYVSQGSHKGALVFTFCNRQWSCCDINAIYHSYDSLTNEHATCQQKPDIPNAVGFLASSFQALIAYSAALSFY